MKPSLDKNGSELAPDFEAEAAAAAQHGESRYHDYEDRGKSPRSAPSSSRPMGRRNVPFDPRGREYAGSDDDDRPEFTAADFSEMDRSAISWPDAISETQKRANAAYDRLMTRFRDSNVVHQLEKTLSLRGYLPDDPFFVVVELLALVDSRMIAATELYGEIAKANQEMSVFVIDEIAQLHPLLKVVERDLRKMQDFSKYIRLHSETLADFKNVAPKLLGEMEEVVKESQERNIISFLFQTMGAALAAALGVLIGVHAGGGKFWGISVVGMFSMIALSAVTFFGGWFFRGKKLNR